MKLGFGLAVAYAIVYTLYAIIHMAVSAQGTMGADGGWQTAVASGVTFAFGAILFALVLGLIAALFGALTVVGLRLLLPRFNPMHLPSVGAMLGFLFSALVWLLLTVILQLAPDSRFTPAFLETYLFWVGVPGLVYLCASAYMGWRLTALRAQHEAGRA